MCRVHGVGGEDLVQKRIDRLVAGDRQLFLLSVIQLPFFQICRARKALASTSFGSSCTSASKSRTYFWRRSVVSLPTYVAARASIQAISRGLAHGLLLLAFSMKLLARLSLLALAMSHAPVGHGTIGIERSRLAKRALGLEVPEAVQLAQTLVEELLGFRQARGHRTCAHCWFRPSGMPSDAVPR